MTLPSMRLIGLACLTGALCSGCGGSSTSDESATAEAEADDQKTATNAAPLGQAPNPSVATVTIHVKDMGTLLNLL